MRIQLISTILFIIVISVGIQVKAQSSFTTTIVKGISINGEEYKGNYKVFIFLNNEWVETIRNNCGFAIQEKIKDEESVRVRFVFEDYLLDFPKIHNSMFNTKWYIGVNDSPPFPDKYVSSEESNNIKRIYYINFESEKDLNKTLLITEQK
jgi:hypothetical protein